jgi:hypothetical protein
MKLVGLMPIRNEEWVVGLSLRAAMLFMDEMVVLDHASSDSTPELLAAIAAEHPGRIHLLSEPDEVWHEAAIRQRLLDAGREAGATHLCALDADEVLTGNLLPSIRTMFAALASGEGLWLPWLAMWRSLELSRQDASPLVGEAGSMVLGFHDAPHLHYAAWSGEYDIHCRHPRGMGEERRLATARSGGGMFHLAFVNWPRLQAKTAWYKMVERLRFPWRRTAAALNAWYACDLDETGLETAAVDPGWWAPYARWRGAVKLDAGDAGDSWYAQECRRLWAEHGPAPFSGLDLWGVPEGRDDERQAAPFQGLPR